MLKKAKAEFGTRQFEQARELSQAVLNSSHQIWLAGLGAFARAQQEGMKMFETLVRQGQQLETRTRQAAVDTASAARGAATAKAKEMQQMAGGTWDKLEQVFEDRVERALSKLGVHTQNDVQQLVERVDALSEAVNRLIATGPGEASAPPLRTRGKRSSGAKAVPKAAAKKRGSKTAAVNTGARKRRAGRRAEASATPTEG